MTNIPRKTPRRPITDEVLMAYADGSLVPEDRQAVREALMEDITLVEKLESYLCTRERLARAFDRVLEAPVPDKVRRSVENVAESPARGRRSSRSFRAPVLAFATAAAVLLAIGWLLHTAATYGSVPPDRQGVAAWPALQRVLDQAPSDASVDVAGVLSVQPKLTFYTNLKLWCRQVELTYGRNLGQEALACRGHDGVWRVRNETEPATRTGQEYAPAGGGTLAAARREIIDGTTLRVEEEKRVIEGGWKARPTP
jgi:hypothetical protein